jgi:hypothetical protein
MKVQISEYSILVVSRQGLKRIQCPFPVKVVQENVFFKVETIQYVQKVKSKNWHLEFVIDQLPIKHSVFEIL